MKSPLHRHVDGPHMYETWLLHAQERVLYWQDLDFHLETIHVIIKLLVWNSNFHKIIIPSLSFEEQKKCYNQWPWIANLLLEGINNETNCILISSMTVVSFIVELHSIDGYSPFANKILTCV